MLGAKAHHTSILLDHGPGHLAQILPSVHSQENAGSTKNSTRKYPVDPHKERDQNRLQADCSRDDSLQAQPGLTVLDPGERPEGVIQEKLVKPNVLGPWQVTCTYYI